MSNLYPSNSNGKLYFNNTRPSGGWNSSIQVSQVWDPVSGLEQKLLHEIAANPGTPLSVQIDALLMGIEALYPGALCSILKLSPDYTLHTYSAPSLPTAYSHLINGVKPGPRVGSCGTAVFLDEPVIVADIATDILWAEGRDAALPFGLRSCWSIPIHYSNGKILGTFAIYHRNTGAPSPTMMAAIVRLGNLIGLVMENREMTDTLRLSNERYSLAARATHDMVWDWDLQQNAIYRNEEGLRNIYGFSTNEPIRQIDDWVARIHPEDVEKVREEIDKIHQQHQDSFEAEYRFLRADNKYVYIYDRGYILRDQNGRALRVIGAAQDITARVRAAEMVRDSEERYRKMFHSNPLPMWIFDLKTHRFLEVNDMAIQHYGYTAEEFLEMTIFDIRPGDDHEKLRGILTQDREDAKVYLRGQWQHRKKNGDLIYVDIHSHRLHYKGRETMLVLANDVTQNILLQKQLNNERTLREQEVLKATIGAQEKERNEIANELHDNVNQILTSAKLYFECVGLYDDNKEEYRTTGIKMIVEAVEELRRIAKSMVSPRLQEIGLIRSIQDLLDNLAAVSKMEIQFNPSLKDENHYPNPLKHTIYRIIQEQLTNVVKHAKATTLYVVISDEEKMLRVTVQDNGIGFETDKMRNGVGITNMINRASLHDGAVEINSAPSAGCRLEVRFPLETKKPS